MSRKIEEMSIDRGIPYNLSPCLMASHLFLLPLFFSSILASQLLLKTSVIFPFFLVCKLSMMETLCICQTNDPIA